MFYNEERFKRHKQDDHPSEAGDVDMIVGEPPLEVPELPSRTSDFIEDQEDVEQDMTNQEFQVEEEGSNDVSLVWVKIGNIFWPAKVVRMINGDVTEIQLFDNLASQMAAQHLKLKPFDKLKKVPEKRSKAWKEAYKMALSLLEK